LSHIQHSLETLRINFPDKWWTHYSFEKEKINAPNLEHNIKSFPNLLAKWRDEIFDDFNLSILKGEYIKYPASIKQIKEVEEYLSTLQPSEFFPDPDVQDLISLKAFQTDFIVPLKLAIDFFAEFIGIVNNKIAVSNKEYITRYYDGTIRAIQEKRCSESALLNLSFLQANIKIAECDHFLAIEGNMLDFLIGISFQLENKLNIKQYAVLIKKKCDFLKSKLLLRRRHERDNEPLYSIINSSEKEIKVSEFKDGGSFDFWLDYLDVHYEMKGGWKIAISRDYNLLKGKELDKLPIKELSRLIKYYKDVEVFSPSSIEAISEIRKLIEIYLDTAKQKDDRFDIFAYRVALNYAINNEFSITCDSKNNVTIEKATELYDEIISIQKETGIKDFFPQTKFLNFLLGQLNIKNHKKEALETLTDCRLIIDKCHEIYKEYKKNVEWSSRYYNYVFQLPFEECLLNLKEEEVIAEVNQLFVSSTFLMPLPKQKYIADFENDRREVTLLESSIKVFENIKTEFDSLQTLKKEIEKVKDDSKLKDVKTIEVLGIFAALISFVAASLPTFKIIETPTQAAMFMLALSTSLCAFIVVLLAASRGLNTFTTHRKTIYGSVLLAALFWCLLIGISYCPPMSKLIKLEKTEINVQKEIDTITNTNNKTIITIKRDTSKIVGIVKDSSKIR